MSQYATSHNGSTIGVRKPASAHRGAKRPMSVFTLLARAQKRIKRSKGLDFRLPAVFNKPVDYPGLRMPLATRDEE